MGDNRVGHILVGLIIANVLVSKLVPDDLVDGFERVDGALSLCVHAESKEHHPASGVEVANGKLCRALITSLRRR